MIYALGVAFLGLADDALSGPVARLARPRRGGR